MTATDELRRLLDERGIEWKDGDAAYEIEWSTPDGRRCSAMYWKPTFSVLISGCTPEQAVAATLGRERTCTMLQLSDYTCQYMQRYLCSECGEFNEQPTVMGKSTPPRYCPNCGRKVDE